MKLKRSNIVYYKDNLFDGITQSLKDNDRDTVIYIPTTFDTTNSQKTDLYQSVLSRFPYVADQAFIQQHNIGDTNRIGLNRDKSLYLFQMFANRTKGRRKIHYGNLVKCMMKVQSDNFAYKSQDVRLEIHCAKFGTGSTGGRWSTIHDLIVDCWAGIPVFVYDKY